jgi:hypothetical protein
LPPSTTIVVPVMYPPPEVDWKRDHAGHLLGRRDATERRRAGGLPDEVITVGAERLRIDRPRGDAHARIR